jgi:hypothetical protein
VFITFIRVGNTDVIVSSFRMSKEINRNIKITGFKKLSDKSVVPLNLTIKPTKNDIVTEMCLPEKSTSREHMQLIQRDDSRSFSQIESTTQSEEFNRAFEVGLRTAEAKEKAFADSLRNQRLPEHVRKR